MSVKTDTFDEEAALAELLKTGTLFANERNYSYKKDDKSEGSTVVLLVSCSDVFAWGVADAQDLPYNEIESLYNMVKKYPGGWGSTAWVCFKRNEQPQKPMKEAMIAANAWDEKLEALPANQYDKSFGIV